MQKNENKMKNHEERTIYVACPYHFFSGGPELAHQLCYALNVLGYAAKMCYYTAQAAHVFWEDVAESQYGRYQTQQAESLAEIDVCGNTVIIPETAIGCCALFRFCETHIWWMSVDNYLELLSELLSELNDETARAEKIMQHMAFFRQPKIIHYVQSQYAYCFCKDNLLIPEEQIMFLSDYINDVFCPNLRYH